MKERILEFLKVENKSSAQFADEIGVQPSGISHIISGRNNPSLDFVIKMLNKYPALSADWLIFGKRTDVQGDNNFMIYLIQGANGDTNSVKQLPKNKPDDNIRLKQSRTIGESADGINESNDNQVCIKQSV